MNKRNKQQYLDAMGIQSWQLKSALDDDSSFEEQFNEPFEEQIIEEFKEQTVSEEIVHSNFSEQPKLIITPPTIINEPQPPQVSDPGKQEVENKNDSTQDEALVKKVNVVVPSDTEIPEQTELERSIQNCKNCPNRTTRLNSLSGQGNSNASIFVISEAPTAEDDRAGHYLTEQALSLFNTMFHCINLSDDYYLTGIIKCHSLSDFLVSDDDINNCSTFLNNQIQSIKPSVLVLLGATQAQKILKTNVSFNELRGSVHKIVINDKEFPVVVTFHPAYLLRNPLYKREALKDLIMIKDLLNE